MKLFEFNTGSSRNYTYASGYGPYESMAFFDSLPEFQKRSRLRYWEVNPEAPGLSIDSSGDCWPDVMSCGHPPPSYFFSRKVLESLQSRNIALKMATMIPIGEIGGAKLTKTSAPDYFVIEGLPGIRVDYSASGFVVDATGSRIPNAPLPNPCILHYDPETWNGMDLFCEDYGDGRGDYLGLICTERIKVIAKEDGWTNVSFQRLRVKGINPFTGLPDANR